MPPLLRRALLACVWLLAVVAPVVCVAGVMQGDDPLLTGAAVVGAAVLYGLLAVRFLKWTKVGPLNVPRPSRAVRFVRSFAPLAWGLAAVALLGGSFFVFAVMGTSAAALMGPAQTAILLVIAGRIARVVRDRRAGVVLVYLDQAVRADLPVPPFLAAAALSERGKTRRRLESLRDRMEAGWPLADAVAAAAPEMPERTLRLLTAAENVGRLPQALARLAAETGTAGRPSAGRGRFRFTYLYPLVLGLGVSTVISLEAIFVAPKLLYLFRDFHLPLQPVSQFVMRVAELPAEYLCVALTVVAIAFLGRTLADLLTGGRSGRSGGFRVADEVWWTMPVAGGIVRDRGLADVFDVVGDAIDSGRPMGQAAAEASSLDVNRVLRRKLARWAEGLETLPPAEAARAAGLPALVAGMLAASPGPATIDGVRFLALYYRNRFSRAEALLEAAAVPAAALGFGVCVAAVALALFLPMIDLINRLAPTMSPM